MKAPPTGFRYPYLGHGDGEEARDAAKKGLTDLGYRNVPVTIATTERMHGTAGIIWLRRIQAPADRGPYWFGEEEGRVVKAFGPLPEKGREYLLSAGCRERQQDAPDLTPPLSSRSTARRASRGRCSHH